MGTKQKGYTIIEVLLFLAISGALFTVSVIGMGGQQNKMRFKSSMEDIEFRVRNTLNNVDQGYSAKANNDKNYSCSGAVTVQIGNDANCIYVGRELNICSSADSFVVSKVAPFNNGDYARKDAVIAGVVDTNKESFNFPGGVTIDASSTGCRVAALYQALGVSNNRVPRYQATAGGVFSSIDDKTPLVMCFKDNGGTNLWAKITVTQADVSLDIGVPASCA